LFDVWLRAAPSDRTTPERFSQITLRTASSIRPGAASRSAKPELVHIGNFVKLSEERGPNQIDRYQRQRKITIVANLVDYALSDAIRDVEKITSELNMPPGYRVMFTGRARSLGETLNNFLLAFGLAIIFMYMILAAQFEHFVHPVSIMLAVPLSLPFAFGWMQLIGATFNIYAIFGLFMLFGIVKKNGILQIDYTNTLRARGLDRETAIRQANRTRLRPILMTTFILVASMIPIALGAGPGAAGRASMATVIIGGQMLCLLLTLLVTPVSYSIFDDWGHGVFWRKKQRANT
jgi:HAE1 family hydrophobic/amphiphilic exporter-1